MKKYIYLCGPTVYNKVHIGNMRPIVTFDLIVRGLKYLYANQIVFIHNITDIDDKIIDQAQKEQTTETNISEKYLLFYQQMLKAFNIETIDLMPKVTDHIDEIAAFIKQLEAKNFAYQLNQSIYFKTQNLTTYGQVANIKIDELKNNPDLEQTNSFDFALWKNKTKGQNWTTSCGQGRPGWHTECALFISKYTQANSLLIHGGGIDLKFPHHENENAQYQALYNKEITNQWLHVGAINLKNQKMSKSLGNIIYADQFINQYQAQVDAGDLFRLLILSTSYRSTIELNDDLINTLIKKQKQIEKIIAFVLINDLAYDNLELKQNLALDLSQVSFSKIWKLLNENIKTFNETKNNQAAQNVFSILKFLGFNYPINHQIDLVKMKAIYFQWQQAIKQKEFEQADQLREILIQNKII